MEHKSYVLDSSALLALIENEEGVGRVESILKTEKVFLPCVVLLEVHYITKAMIAAVAQRQQATLVHKDPEYEALAEEVEMEALPYKSR